MVANPRAWLLKVTIAISGLVDLGKSVTQEKRLV